MTLGDSSRRSKTDDLVNMLLRPCTIKFEHALLSVRERVLELQRVPGLTRKLSFEDVREIGRLDYSR
jgi:hypothetical protein